MVRDIASVLNSEVSVIARQELTVVSFVKLSILSVFGYFLILCPVSFQTGRVASGTLTSLCARLVTAGGFRAVATALFFVGDTSENIVSTLLNALIGAIAALDSGTMLITLAGVVL